jgi:hypothetical protein
MSVSGLQSLYATVMMIVMDDDGRKESGPGGVFLVDVPGFCFGAGREISK